MLRQLSGVQAGSSPRGRGKHLRPGYRRESDGLIPARAGKTRRSGHARTSSAAHPRAGGENLPTPSVDVAVSGSSPRGRGKRDQCVQHLYARGLIPARAGKTPASSNRLTRRWAHPRAGGENGVTLLPWQELVGSSPRGRGKRDPVSVQAQLLRLIPARAGKTPRRYRRTTWAWAHPRAGGENEGYSLDGRLDPGSSPRGRGKPVDQSGSLSRRGLIPARAGKTK